MKFSLIVFTDVIMRWCWTLQY